MTILLPLRIAFAFINRILSMMYAWLPAPLGTIFLTVIAVSAVLLLIQLTIVLKEIIFNWL